MDNDYPASHSMDTCFFAIDREGHVAIFDTGEAGAVPAQALAGDDAYSARQQLTALPRVEVIHERQGRVTPNQPEPVQRTPRRTRLALSHADVPGVARSSTR